ncbi:MAG: nucleotide kinase [Clostridia bacterium]|nr:nucleotide kinase [Clostridia bacterium]
MKGGESMHLFLTGERGVGKSTALRRTLELLNVPTGGFRTCYGPGREVLYLSPAWEEECCTPDRAVARMEDGRPVPDSAAFDRLGAAAIRDSGPWARLLLFDECGKLEREAGAFRRAVLDALDGAVPILGVVKPDRMGSWLTEIERHPGVTILEVTKENRDGLPARLAASVRDEL